MDNQIFQLFNDKIDANKEEQNARLDKIDAKLDTVLQFRWQMGGALVVIALAVNFIVKALI
jgi:tetrahydromethanopterin S-methyltransferase subunit G